MIQRTAQLQTACSSEYQAKKGTPKCTKRHLERANFTLVPLISTEGALRRPLTYDDHPIPSIHLLPSRLNELNRPKIDLVDDRVDLQ